MKKRHLGSSLRKWVDNKLNILYRYVPKQKATTIAIVAIAFGATVLIVALSRSQADVLTRTISNQATAVFCSEGDALSVCDPISSLFSGTAASNFVRITAQQDVEPPTTPGTVAVVAGGPNSVTVTWTASVDDLQLDRYFLDLATDETFTSFVTGYQNKDVGNVTSVLISGLTANTTYYTRIRAQDIARNISTDSQIASASTATAPDINVPTVPSGLTAVANSPEAIKLEWTAASDNVAVTGYKVDVATNSNFQQKIAGWNAKDVGNVTSVSIDQLSEQTTYHMRVRSYDGAGNISEPSAGTSVSTPAKPDTAAPGVPQNLRLTAPTDSSIVITWDASSDNVGVTGYKLTIATDSSFNDKVPGYDEKDLRLATAETVSELTADTSYHVRVRAYDLAGNHSGYSSGDITTRRIVLPPSPSPSPSPSPNPSPSPSPIPSPSPSPVPSPTSIVLPPAPSNPPVPRGPTEERPLPPPPTLRFKFKLEHVKTDAPIYTTVHAFDDTGRSVAAMRAVYDPTIEGFIVTDPTFTHHFSNNLIGDNRQYIFLVKSDDHLRARIIANPTAGDIGAGRKLYFGDVDGTTNEGGYLVSGDNIIQPRDIVTIIRRRVQGHYPPSVIVDAIRNRIRHVAGE